MKKLLFIILTIISIKSFGQNYNFDQGVKAFKENDYERALKHFDIAIEDNPKEPISYYYRSIIYNSYEQYSYALRDITSSIKLISNKEKELLSGAYQLRATIYFSIENNEKCFEDFNSAIKLTPKDPQIYLDRAQYYFEIDQFKNAEADYKQALKIDETLVMAYAGLGRNYINEKRYLEAEKILNQAIKLSPDYSGGYKFRGRVNYELKKYDDAIEDLYYALTIDVTQKDLRFMFIEYASKNYPLAFAKVNAMLATNPDKEEWLFIRATLYEETHNYNAAIIDYSKLIEISDITNQSRILSYRASCYKDAGLYQESINDYNEAIKLDSTDAYAYGYRGDVKRLKGNYELAKLDFNKAISIEPRESWFYYRRGWTNEFLKEYEKALTDYNQAISIDKNYIYTYLNRGRLYEKQFNDYKKAKLDYEYIVNNEVNVKESGNCKQYALYHLGQKAKAIEWMDSIITKYPTDGNYYDAACLYSLMDKSDLSVKYLKLAFENGYRDFVHLKADNDLMNLKNNLEFKSLLSKWESNHNQIGASEIEEKTEEKTITNINSESIITIPMKPRGSGTYEVSCKINDLGLNLIFDTGASDISISQTEVDFMLKNNYLNENDIIGSNSYMDANGDVEIGTTIILRNVEIGGFNLKNVRASVVHKKNAPLLFGQSALSKYGKITIDNTKKTITITK
jgi:clan AA aspartic protease (TIGR02281 family)